MWLGSVESTANMRGYVREIGSVALCLHRLHSLSSYIAIFLLYMHFEWSAVVSSIYWQCLWLFRFTSYWDIAIWAWRWHSQYSYSLRSMLQRIENGLEIRYACPTPMWTQDAKFSAAKLGGRPTCERLEICHDRMMRNVLKLARGLPTRFTCAWILGPAGFG